MVILVAARRNGPPTGASAAVLIAERRVCSGASSIAPLGDGRSEHDKPVAPRATSAPEGRQHRSSVEWKVAAKGFATDRERRTVGSRVADHEECVCHEGVITRLEHHPTLGGLDVGEPSLDLERVATTVAVEHGIPRPEVRPPLEGHLRAESSRRREPRPQPLEQAEVTAVPHRIAVREESKRRRKTHRDCEPTQLPETNVVQCSSFESIDLTRRHPDGPPDVGATDAGCDPSLADLLARVSRHRSGERGRTDDAAVADGHAAHPDVRRSPRAHPPHCYAWDR